MRVPYSEELRSRSLEKAEYFYVKVLVRKSKQFTHEGLDIFSKADIDVKTSLYGGEIDVPGLYDPKLKLKIAPGTSSHQMLKLPGEGLRHGGVRGDYFLEIGINMEECTKEDEKVLQDMCTHETDDCADAVTPQIHERKF